MQNRVSRIHVTFVLSAIIAVFVSACASEKATRARSEESERATLADLTPPARAAAENLIAGGKVEKIDKEVEKGKTVYDVEATVNGKHMEYTIGTDGAVLATEMGIALTDLPEATRAAAEKYFGGVEGLDASKVAEDGRTTYEVEGKKGGKKVAATFDEAGHIIEEEK